MSSATWTATALSSEARHLDCKIWRLVEAQHRVATVKLVDTRAEQVLLEQILEEHKPPVPRDLPRLHYLLYGPFGYGSRLTSGSRFRSERDPGVFYAAGSVRTAAAEVAYWRWRFMLDSAGLKRLQPSAFTAFRVPVKAPCLDLRRAPFVRVTGTWLSDDYSATQALGKAAREAAIGAIVYESVRDPERGFCTAVLTPQAFAATRPDSLTQTWVLAITKKEAIWMHQHEASFSIPTTTWHSP